MHKYENYEYTIEKYEPSQEEALNKCWFEYS